MHYESMVFCKDRYDGDLEAMWVDVAKFVQIILKNENLCVIQQEDFDTIVIQYEHDDNNSSNCFGCDQPIWLTPEEQELILDNRSAPPNS